LRSLAAQRHNVSVRLRLLGRVLIFSACVTLVLTLLQLYLEYRRDVSALESQLEQIGKSNLDSLAESLWGLDEKQLRLQLAGILRLPDIRSVEVIESGSTGYRLVIRLGKNSISLPIKHEYPLRYNVEGKNLMIGTLYVEATLADIYHRLFNTGLTILVSQAAEIFLVSLFIFYIFNDLVTRHLFAIAAFVDSYQIHDPPLPLHLRRPPRRHEDELQRVVTAFNALSDDLQSAYRNLHDVNDQLTRDVAARRRAEAVLQEREARIRRLVDANIIGIFIWDLEGRIIEANDAFLRMVGYDREDLISGRMRVLDMTPPEWRDRTAARMAEVALGKTVQAYEKEYFRKDGSRVPVLVGSTLFEEERGREGVAFVVDLTERKQAEAEARESERRYREMQIELEHANRVATMGQLTASIAHEVNQPIATARNNAASALRFLSRTPPDLEEVREALACIVNDVDRAGNVIGGIRKLITKAPAPRDDRLDINEAIREVIVLTRGETLKNGVSVQMQLAQGLPLIRGGRVQLQQVIVNLIVNAVEAMAGAGDGPRELTIVSGVDDANEVVVEVRDTGPGIDPADLDRLFQSFYTTKPDGIGMGLAICRSIVDAHGGRLWADANEPRGAVFQVTLPAGNMDS
jgi:PAS domain S-box-containing protein